MWIARYEVTFAAREAQARITNHHFWLPTAIQMLSLSYPKSPTRNCLGPRLLATSARFSRHCTTTLSCWARYGGTLHGE